MLFYFWKKGLVNKDSFGNLFLNEENWGTDKKNNKNIINIYSKFEEDLVIDVFLKQSISNLNDEYWFNLNFDKVRKDEEWRKFIETN